MDRTKRVYRLTSAVLIIILLIGCAVGCRKDENNPEAPHAMRPAGDVTVSPPAAQTPGAAAGGPSATQPAGNAADGQDSGQPAGGEADTPAQPDIAAVMNLSFSPAFNRAGEAYTPIDVTPRVADYKIAGDLSNVINLDQFPNLTAEQREKLASNGFVVASSDQEQLFYIYEDNTYKKIPNFVTTDSVLQVYHIFYDYALRSVEGMTLLPDALQLNQNMLDRLQAEYAAVSDPGVKAEMLTALGYFGVAQLAFGESLPPGFPSEIIPLVDSEMQLFNAAGGTYLSPLFGYEIDYSLFTPRGHYTRSEELEKYFRGMSWYGTVPFPLYKNDGKTRDTQSAMRAIIIAAALSRLPAGDGGSLWENIYSTTAFFVGAADDATPFQFAEIISRVYGDSPDLNDISDPVKLDLFYKEADALPKPRINAGGAITGNAGSIPTGPQFRFMGQRYIPDSEILQELSDPILRPFPTGLDVFASLGSKRAFDLINTLYKPAEKWPEYPENFERMKAKFTALPDSVWQSNMYYTWLWTQNSLTGEYGRGYPMFMRNTAWQDKSLATALGSWAEMRHDTILYAKGSGAECGGDNEPPVIRAYVEPNPEFYNRLLWLTSYSRSNLTARGILPWNIEYTCDNFERVLTFLRDCSIKELRGEDLSTEEYDSLLTYGGWLEYLTLNCIENGDKWYLIESETDRNMAVVADVHTVLATGYLEEAVGTAAEIYVVVPADGNLYLTRGAMFDYFEFTSQKRLTDEEWQATIRTDPPTRPPFTSSFLSGAAPKVPAPAEPYSTGC